MKEIRPIGLGTWLFGWETPEEEAHRILRYALDHGIRYFDITPISRKGLDDPSLVADDGLHPSGKMYAQWVNLIAEGLLK